MTYLYQVQKYQYDITQLPSCKTFSKRKEKHCAACLHPGLIDPVIFPVCLLLPSHKEELTKTSTIRHEENYFFTKQIYPACDSFLYSIHIYFDNGFFFFSQTPLLELLLSVTGCALPSNIAICCYGN